MDIRILGLGNVLMGDDSVGPYVIEALEAGYEFPGNVSVIDVGTPGLDLAPFLIGADAVIVIDSVRSDGNAGALRRYRRDAILAHAPQQRLGPHDPGFKQTLLTLDFAGCGPREVLLVGVIPETTAPLARMSSAVREAVPDAVREVLQELSRLGAPAYPRRAPLALAPWWEREDFPRLRDISQR
jgi:hydrogenase maturation protease